MGDPNNELEYFELSITPQIIALISTETTCNAQQFSENMPNSKISLGVHQRHDTILLLALLLLQGNNQKPDNKCCFSKRKILATFTLWNSLRHLVSHVLKFLYFADNEGTMKPHVVPGDCGN